MSKFSVGDRVAVVGIEDEYGKRGEVVKINSHPSWPIEVRFDEGSLLHGLCREEELEFEHVYDELSKPLVIEPNDNSFFASSNLVSSDDAVNHPSHYTAHPSGVECIQITEHMNFNLGNATKYVWRAGLKSDDPIQDLQKAAWYIEREIQRLGGTVD